MKSDVFLAETEGKGLKERLAALSRLLDKIGPFSSIRKGELVPVKLTIGDAPCVYHMDPGLVRSVVERIRASGGKPFLFDTSVIYQGQRQNAVDHLSLAEQKGFGYSGVGAPFIVADGVLGQDGREFPVHAEAIKTAKLPSFIGMLDSLVVLSHPTGHIVSGYAGALKNVAMGMSCRSTKQVQHSSLKPKVITKKCTACGCCIAVCPVKAIALAEDKAFIDQKTCVGCGECLCACKFDAIFINWQEDPAVFCRRMVEVARFILFRFKNSFFINFAFDITKDCDCMSAQNGEMAAGDIGILASRDIVSLERATADLASEKPASDFFKTTKDVTDGMISYAARQGLGSLDYNLIKV